MHIRRGTQRRSRRHAREVRARARLRGGSAVWLGVGALVILAIMMRRHEKASNAIRAAYSTARERFGGTEQPRQYDTDFSSEEAGEFLIQENPEAETEGSSAEGEEGSGWEEESQGGKSATATAEGRFDVARRPIEEHDSLTVSQVTQRLGELSLEEVEQLRAYEAENRNRRSIMQCFETRSRTARIKTSKRRLTRRPRRALESNYATCRQGTGTSCARFATGEEEEGRLMRTRRSEANKDSGKCSYYTK